MAPGTNIFDARINRVIIRGFRIDPLSVRETDKAPDAATPPTSIGLDGTGVYTSVALRQLPIGRRQASPWSDALEPDMLRIESSCVPQGHP